MARQLERYDILWYSVICTVNVLCVIYCGILDILWYTVICYAMIYCDIHCDLL